MAACRLNVQHCLLKDDEELSEANIQLHCRKINTTVIIYGSIAQSVTASGAADMKTDW